MVIGVSVGVVVAGACYVGYKIAVCAIEFSEFLDYFDDDDDCDNG